MQLDADARARRSTPSSSSGSTTTCSTSRSPPIASTRCRWSDSRANSPRPTARRCACRRLDNPGNARLKLPIERPSVAIESADCTRFVAQRFDGVRVGAGAGLDARSARAGRPAADQQPRRHFELRDARDRTAAALLRCGGASTGRIDRARCARGRTTRHARRRRTNALAASARHRRPGGERSALPA